MANVLLLPKLDPNSASHPEVPAQVGAWNLRYDRSELDRVSEALDIQHVDAKYVEIDSIPDAWARPLLFEMALFDDEHPLHKRARGEWRGLLALLALRDVRGLKTLSATRIQLSDEGEQPKFLKMLRRLVPKRRASDNLSWMDLDLIQYGEHTIGMTSPVTLVCTAVNYYGSLPQSQVGWFNGRVLENPAPQLNQEERKLLARWVRAVATEVAADPAQAGEQASLANKLKAQLDRFANDLAGKDRDLQPDELASTGYGFRGLLRAIDKPLKAAAADPHQSHVRLVPSRPASPDTALLVVAPDIADQWDEQPENILVIGPKPLSAVVPYEGLSDTARRDQLAGEPLAGAEWRKPADFFTDRLFLATQKSAFPTAEMPEGANSLLYNDQKVTPLLPITKALLNHLTPKDIARRVNFRLDQKGVAVQLTLPLAGKKGVSRDYVVEKLYLPEHIYVFDDVPVLEIWPSFAAPQWKRYHTYFSKKEEKTFFAEPYVHPESKPTERLFKNRRGEIERAVYVTEDFPEAVVCTADVAAGASARKEEAGLILLEPPETKAPRLTWEIGVDFGTTGTNVYYREEDGTARPMRFEDRFVRVTSAPERARPRLADDFIPGEEVDTPFLSVYEAFPEPEDPPRPLLDGHILYILEGTYSAYDPTATGVSTDLKWSSRPEDRKRATAFLTQLGLQCAAEAMAQGASRVKWRYSYPTAFSAKQRQGLPQQWVQIVQRVSDWTGLEAVGTPQDRTEGEATALFFREQQGASPAAGAVYIDIGGGTSDVAIWQDQEPQWQTSLRFAGRDLLLEPLRQGFGMNDQLFRGLDGVSDDRRAFYAAADAYLSRRGGEVMARLPDYARTPEVESLVQHIALGLGGLLHYIGLVLRKLVREEKYRPEVPAIFVGGNGSKLFHWLGAGHFDADHHTSRLFRRVFAKASALEQAADLFRLELSKAPKAEAAHGLVSRHTLGGSAGNDSVVWAGESFQEEGTLKDWDEPLTPERLYHGIGVSSEFEQLKCYLNVFNEYAGQAGATVAEFRPTKRTLHAVRQRLSNVLQDYQAQQAVDIEVEPLFVLALKALLEVRLEQ